MGICETCGNEYKNVFSIKKDDQWYDFDSFQCAIQKLAPKCRHCASTIIGHGVEKDADVFCCNHCVRRFELNLPLVQTIAP